MEMSITERLAQFACQLSFTHLSNEEVHAAKRSILDTLACGIGGYGGDSSRIVRNLVAELGGPEESTVIGDGIKVSCANAAFANGAMVRYLDYNDTYIRITENFFTGPLHYL